jgi:hypothetical protein
MRIVTVVGFGLILTSFLLVSSPTLAQDSASIAGAVTDETGGFLPGVTVEVQGPSILAPRTAVTDSAGIFTVTNLPSGTYTVTFELAGFNTMVREDVVLTGAFVANVDMTLPVGELSETVTVTSAAPLVDIVSTRQQSVLTAERVNVLPGAAGIFTAADYVPGATTSGGRQANMVVVHGSDPADGQPAMDGVRTGTQLQGRNEWTAGVGLITNEAIVTEVVFDVSSQNAEFATSGVRTNIIPKAGGNNFNFDFFGRGTTDKFASNNLTPALEEQGFRFAPTAFSWNINPAAGGPILQNKLWFYTSFYKGLSKSYILDRFFVLDEPSTPDDVTADDLRAFSHNRSGQQTLRVTHQLSQRNKMMYSVMNQTLAGDRSLGLGFGRTGAESAYWYDLNPAILANARWTSPLTSRLLIEADVAYQQADVNTGPQDHGGELRMAKRDQVTNELYHSSFQNHHNSDFYRGFNASASYVTGSHNFKAGFNIANNRTALKFSGPGDIYAGYVQNGVPNQVRVHANGNQRQGIIQNCDCGIYLQDAFTMDRLTVNGGFRYDWFRNSVPGGLREAGFWAPEVIVPDPLVENIPNWKNYSGRIGGAFDLFGDGSTAVKASAGRYVANEGTGVTQGFNPIYPYNTMENRLWTDLNGDMTAINPDGTPQFAEVGPSNNPNFGTSTISTIYDDNLRRGTNWEYNAGIERQLGSGWAASVMWFHRNYGNFSWRDNLNTDTSDWVFAGNFIGPSAGLPSSGQGTVIPIYNRGTTGPSGDGAIQGGNRLLTQSPDRWRTWNGFEFVLDGELPRGGFMTASYTTGTSTNHNCTTGNVENPNSLFLCETSSPYRPLAKLSGALPLPFETMISGLYQVASGNDVSAGYVITPVDFPALDLGPNVSQSLSKELIQPNSVWEDYVHTTQIRFSKVITVADVRTRVYVDVNNILNGARVTSRNSAFGGRGVFNPIYGRLNRIEAGRTLRFGVQAYF